MEFILSAFLCTAIHISLLVMRYVPFSEIVTKNQKRTLIVIYSIFLFVDLAINVVIAKFGVLTFAFYKQSLIIFSVLMTIVNILVIKKRLREHLFTCGLTAVFFMACFTVVSYIQSFAELNNQNIVLIEHTLLLIAVSIFSYPIIKKQLVKSVTPFLNIETALYWSNVWIIPCAMFITSYLTVPFDSYAQSLTQVISRIFMMLATFFICRTIAADYERIEEQQAMTDQLNMQKKYYAALSDNVEKTRKSRHDLKHHIAAIIQFAKNNEKEELINYCSNLTQMQYSEIDIPYSGNAAADGILYHYAVIAHNNNIDFNITGIVKSGDITDVDLCVLLGNALDNAVTGCLTAQSKRFINVSSKSDGNVLAIMISNSFDGVVKNNKKGNILSRKRDDREGVGITSIRSVCKKYGGNLKIDYNNNVFTCMMLLNTEKQRVEQN